MSLRLALARLVATPLFTIFSILSLAVGVAVTTAVYSVVDTLILAELGIADPESATFIATASGGRPQPGSVSVMDFEDLRRAQTSFNSLTAALAIAPSVAATGNAEITTAEAVDGAYFATLGIAAAHGRMIQPGDDDAAAQVVVLSDDYWRSRLAADPAVIGRTIRINGRPFEIVGVMTPRYKGVFGALVSTRLWIPMKTEAQFSTALTRAVSPRDRRRLLVLGRLRPDRTRAEASAELGAIAARLDRDFPSQDKGVPARGWSAAAIAGIDPAGESLRRFGMTIVALVSLVLVVACTNLANLVLARGTARQGELAVRMAMGASRGRLIREQCVESLILAALGTIASYLAFLGVAAFMTTDFVMGLPFGGTVTLSVRPAINTQAVTVALACMVLALGVFGLEPAVQLARSLDIRSALAAGASGIRPRIGRQRMVIRWQVAIAAGFFIVATMFIRSTVQQSRHDPGVDIDRVTVAVLNFDNGDWDEARIRRTIERVFVEARASQDIVAVAASTGLPFGVPALQVNVAVPDDPDGLQGPAIAAVAATPSIFATLGVGIVRGRAFNDSDGPEAAPAIIISELTARQFFGSVDAVGRSMLVRTPSARGSLANVVGVARDTDVRSIYSDRRALIYLPFSQHFSRDVTITATSAGGPARAMPGLREALRKADPDLAITAIGPGSSILAGRFVLVRSLGRGALYLGGLTLVLAMVGLFGVQSHVVAHRTREIGVRMSVGATATQIKLMVLKDGYRPVLEGLVLGLWGGLAGRVILRAYTDLDVAIIDPWMLLLTPIPLIVAACWACYLPAARAARVDPTLALRCE